MVKQGEQFDDAMKSRYYIDSYNLYNITLNFNNNWTIFTHLH